MVFRLNAFAKVTHLDLFWVKCLSTNLRTKAITLVLTAPQKGGGEIALVSTLPPLFIGLGVLDVVIPPGLDFFLGEFASF